MVDRLKAQIEQLQTSISGLEAQRSLLGDAIIDPAIAAIRQQLAGLEEQRASQAAQGEERRLITILFMDMVGSTSMAEKMDPEEWRQVVSDLHATLGQNITDHHGMVVQYLGDGLLAFFGAQEASEHDPENAIRAALEAQEAITQRFSARKVQLRAGIHTGLVVVGELGEAAHKEFTGTGDAMNLAARLQSAAPPGGILISHDTYRYVRGVFDLTPQPLLSVKGKSQPLQTYLVRRARPRPFRNVARGVAGIEIRTVGREAEKQQLLDAYMRAYRQHGIVWTQLVSEPGVGKSRLLDDMNEWIDLREETVRLLRARAFQDDTNQPFALVRRMWFDRFQISDDIPLAQAEFKWVERFKEFSGPGDFEEPAHFLGLLVGLPFNDSAYIKGMRTDPVQIKGRALVVSRELVRALRQQMPVVVLLEDLQWTDNASWEYLMEVFLAKDPQEQSNGLFILGAARPEWHPPEKLTELFKTSLPEYIGKENWGIKIDLEPLTDKATRLLARELLQRVKDVPTSMIDLLVERSEGVPYFTEEIVNWFIDHGILDTRGEQWLLFPEKLKEEPLPATLQHLLLTRLSSLSQGERATLQRGAIFGKRFWTGGVEALGVTGGAEMLGHLQPRGFVEVQPDSAFSGDTEWSFHHNLLQEVTYESVLKRERAALHKVAAGWLEQQACQTERLKEFAGLLGEHYERAGELSTAADWYISAGKHAMSQGAPREAKSFYTQALALLPPVDKERRWQTLLGAEDALSVLVEAQPWKEVLDDLLELATAFNDANYLAEVYIRQAIYGSRTDEGEFGRNAAQEALRLARQCGNDAIEIKALSLVALNNADLGIKDGVADMIEQALTRARSLGDEGLLAFILHRAAYCYSVLGDFDRYISLQHEQIEMEHRLGNRAMEAIGLGNLGGGYVGLGLYKQARPFLEQARAIDENLGSRRSLAYILSTLSEVYLDSGDLRRAHQTAEQGLEEIVISADARGKAYLLHILGNVLFAEGDYYGSERRFVEALDIVMNQGIAPLVNVGKSSLALCYVMQGRLDEASKLIKEVWDYLQEQGWVGMDNPVRVYHHCAEVFDALGEPDIAIAVLNHGYRALREVAETINVPEWRQSFLENVPYNRELIEMWERKNR